MTLDSLPTSQINENADKLCSSEPIGSLYALKYHPHRIEYLKKIYKQCSGKNFDKDYFTKIEEACLPFFRALDNLHDDALKFRSSNIWKETVPDIYILSTPYMLMPDEQFLKIDSLYIKYQSPHNKIADRLEFIERTRPELIHGGAVVETDHFMNESAAPCFSLKELRQIKNPEVIKKLWEEYGYTPDLFSEDQKKML